MAVTNRSAADPIRPPARRALSRRRQCRPRRLRHCVGSGRHAGDPAVHAGYGLTRYAVDWLLPGSKLHGASESGTRDCNAPGLESSEAVVALLHFANTRANIFASSDAVVPSPTST